VCCWHRSPEQKCRIVRQPPKRQVGILSTRRRRLVRATGDFGIVVVGVIVALAADGWRQDLIDRRSERDYLARLATDLELGREQLDLQEGRFQRAHDAARTLMESVETPGVRDSVLLHQFQAVARSGFDESALLHDATYRELTTTGRLMVIQNANFRQQVVDYYAAVSSQVSSMTNLSENLANRFIQLTGYYPYVFSNGDAELSPAAQDRLLREVRDNPELRREVRELNARLAYDIPRFEGLKRRREALAQELR
jgi:hypothetical protein